VSGEDQDDGVLARISDEALDDMEPGDWITFTYRDEFDRQTKGIVLLWDDEWRAYRNVCPHHGVPLDARTGDIFDDTDSVLLCDTHGARFRPEDGRCTMGPCEGDRLKKLGVREADEGLEIVRAGLSLTPRK
jgi:nitrite reductase/ring-hydroxylating ferredoxin subunit